MQKKYSLTFSLLINALYIQLMQAQLYNKMTIELKEECESINIKCEIYDNRLLAKT
jgi:hypothetical protein